MVTALPDTETSPVPKGLMLKFAPVMFGVFRADMLKLPMPAAICSSKLKTMFEVTGTLNALLAGDMLKSDGGVMSAVGAVVKKKSVVCDRPANGFPALSRMTPVPNAT